jgi:hypothetical protein
MKAKYYIGILSALILAGIPLKAQYADNRDFRNDNASIIVNNYYDDYDYYFSSRINRFHRSYSAFEYYSPVFTETYWYNYRPYSWGVSIYGGTGLGFGLSYNYPVYYYGWNYGNWYSYDYGWYDPYYGSYWWGYDPFYYSWYSPVFININIGNRWGHNYWGWNRHNYWGWNRHNYWYNDYSPIYNTYNNYNNYPANRYSSREYPDRGRPAEYNRTNSGGDSRREAIPAPDSRTGVNNSNDRVRSNAGIDNNPTRRSAEVRNNTGNTGNNNANVNNGNNRNSRVDGNNGNFGENNRNTNNNGNNRNSRTDGNNGNFGNNQNTRNQNGNQVNTPDNVRTNTGSTRSTVTQPSMSSNRRIEQPVPARSSTPSRTGTTMSQGRSSTPSRTGTTMSQGRSSSPSRAGTTMSQGRSSSSRSASSSSTSKSSSGSSSSSKKSRR